jgi:anti-anti-sigma regulatory factor
MAGGGGWTSGRRHVVLTVDACVAAADVPRLAQRLYRMLQAEPAARAWCDVADVVAPDLDTVDALARLQLRARALGAPLELCNVSPLLRELLTLAGLAQTLPIPERPEG